MGFRVLEVRPLKPTAEEAKKYRDMTPCPGDRALNRNRVNKLRRQVAEGKFHGGEWAVCLCKQTGLWYRVNGKHTATVLADLDRVPDGVTVTLKQFEADTLADLAILYSTYDTSSRNNYDLNRAFQANHEVLAPLSPKIVNLSISGLSWHFYESMHATKNPQEKAELLYQHADFAVWANRFRDQRGCFHLLRVPVFAAMARTWLKDSKAADRFWDLVRYESGPVFTSPDRKLAAWLKSIYLRVDRWTKAKQRPAEDKEIMVKCLHAWNAWRENRDTDLRYYRDKPIPGAV